MLITRTDRAAAVSDGQLIDGDSRILLNREGATCLIAVDNCLINATPLHGDVFVKGAPEGLPSVIFSCQPRGSVCRAADVAT